MIGEVLVNRFRLEERLGGGAQGEIYLARDLELSRLVAVKIPNEKVDENFVNNFKREAKLLVKFEHANVVTLHDYYDPPGGMPFLVMEYLQGQPLDVRLKNKELPLTRKQLRDFSEQMCSALQKAHEAGLVHRDIKPSNVMLVDEGKRSERFVMLDLGIAKLADFATITNPTIMKTSGEFSGTIAYMSPEQLEGGKVDFRSDIYSFGTTLYQILTGQLPFAPPDSYAGLFGFMQKVVKESPPSMTEVAPGQEFSPQLEEVVQDCMAKKAADRPDSMQTVSQRLLQTLPRDIASAMADTQILSQDTIQNWEASIARSSAKSYLGWAFAALVMVFGGVWFVYRGTEGSPAITSIPQPPPTIDVTTSKALRITAGDTATLTVVVTSDLDGNATLHIEGIPGIAWDERAAGEPLDKLLRVHSREPESVDIKATAAVDANLNVAEKLTMTVSIDDKESGDQLTNDYNAALKLQPPRVWLENDNAFRPDPTSGLFPHPLNDQVGPGKKIYLAGRIERVMASDGKEVRIPFQLIHRGRLPGSDKVPAKWPRDAKPYYLMENKVRNQWVLDFAAAHPDGFDDKAWTYDGENSKYRPNDGLYSWLTNPKDYPDLPAMNLRVDEAEVIAQWIGNGRGTLPRQADWDGATGWWDQKVEYIAKDWRQGPYRGVWNAESPLRIALNLAPGTEPPAAVGSSADDVSPYGCRDMAGNGLEFTADIYLERTMSQDGTVQGKLAILRGDDEAAKAALKDSWTYSRGRHYFRGGSANSMPESPLTYGDIDEKEWQELVISNRGRDVGFRVMIPID